MIYIYIYKKKTFFAEIHVSNPIAFRTAKTLWRFGRSECKRVNLFNKGTEAFHVQIIIPLIFISGEEGVPSR